MTRSKSSRKKPPSPRRPNLMALLIAAVAVGVLYLDFDPVPAGAEGQGVAAHVPPPPPVAIPDEDEAGSGRSSARNAGGDNGSVVRGRAALLLQLLLLEKGIRKLEEVPSYTATFMKQERIGQSLGDEQLVELKVRHEPFSVYMKWLSSDVGREVLYVEGQNDGEMLVHAGGWKARLIPALSIDPQGSLAMRESRYPVTMAGLLPLARTMVDYRVEDIRQEELPVRCTLHFDQEFDGRNCYCFIVQYDSPKISAVYRKSVIYIDKELSLPVFVKNYGWPVGEDDAKLAGEKLDEATLIEHYGYTSIRHDQRLADRDFDRANEDYRFRR